MDNKKLDDAIRFARKAGLGEGIKGTYASYITPQGTDPKPVR